MADATASPYLALAVLVQAGLEGIRRDIEPRAAEAAAAARVVEEALELLEACAPAADWLGADVLSAYLRFKRAEIASLDDVDETEICRRYAQVY